MAIVVASPRARARQWPREVEVEAEITYQTTFKARLLVEETEMADLEALRRHFLRVMWDGDLTERDTVIHSEEVRSVYRVDARCKPRAKGDPYYLSEIPWCRIHDEPMTRDDPKRCYASVEVASRSER